MKVLTAAPYTFNGVDIGFCECRPGELVMLRDMCECDCHSLDEEDCGCHLDCDDGAPFSGLESMAGTTTARVTECDLTTDALSGAVRAALGRAGWLVPGLPDDVARSLVSSEVARIRQASEAFSVGTLISVASGRTFAVHETQRGR